MRFDYRRLSTALIAAVALAAPGCQPGTPRSASTDSARSAAGGDSSGRSGQPNVTQADSVVLRTDKTKYRPGEAMTLTLENKGSAHYTVNPCSRALERAEGSAWTPVDEPGRMCTMEAWLLDAHATRSGPTELPSPLAPGRYRVVVRLTMERADGTGSAVSAVSAALTVS
jgi:hypothetical protein